MDKNILIIDCGSGYCKAGFSGEIDPSIVIPTTVWHPISNNMITTDDKSSILFGSKALEAENGLLIHPIEKRKIVKWDDMELFLDNLFANELKVKPEDYCIFMTEPPLTTKSSRETLTQLLFEKFSAPYIFVTNGAVLTSYGACKYSGLVLDVGYDSSIAVPIEYGYPYSSCIQTMDVGGKDVSEYLLNLLIQKGYEGRKIKNSINLIKETHCYIEDEKNAKIKSDNKNIKITKFNLPDGIEIILDKEKFIGPEILFHPEMINKTLGGVDYILCSALSSIDHTTKNKFEGDNLILAGGSTLFEGFNERLKFEIDKDFGGKYKNRMNFINIKERKNLQWIGASIYSLMHIFKGLCTSKEEYNNYGTEAVHNKCFY
jgi:actin beta/gamma 1